MSREVLETLYGLSLTGFLVLISQGGYAQIIVGVCLAFTYAKMHDICQPYEDHRLNVVKSISLWQIVFIFSIALISSTNMFDNNDWRFKITVFAIVFGNIPLELFVSYVVPLLIVDVKEKVQFHYPVQDDL